MSSSESASQVAGQLLEGFVAGELKRQLTWSEADARLFHYRDRNGAEVDLVLETLHTGSSSVPFGERITALPIDALWASSA